MAITANTANARIPSISRILNQPPIDSGEFPRHGGQAVISSRLSAANPQGGQSQLECVRSTAIEIYDGRFWVLRIAIPVMRSHHLWASLFEGILSTFMPMFDAASGVSFCSLFEKIVVVFIPCFESADCIGKVSRGNP